MKKIDETIRGQTPLSEDYREKLIPKHLNLLSELNEFEQSNILNAQEYYFLNQKANFDPTVVKDIFKLHERMFKDVWKYAGKKRNRITNIGVFPEDIYPELKKLVDDLTFWIENQTYDLEDAAIRFHFRLVVIHPFDGGNGRHARLSANLFLKRNKKPPLKWGGGDLIGDTPERNRYIDAIQKADQGDIGPLIKYCLS